MKRIEWTLPALLLLGATVGLGPAFDPAEFPPEHPGCDVAAESSWGGGSEVHWQETARFGDGSEWMDGLTGVAFEPSLGLVAHDGSQGLIWILEEDLQLRHSFGRFGEGPGELQALDSNQDQLRYPARSFVAASRDHVYLWDRRRLSVFDHEGGLVETHMTLGSDGSGSLAGWGLRFLAADSDGMIFGHSRFETDPPGEILSTGRFVEGHLLSLDSFEINWPGSEGAMATPRVQSVWGSNGRCAMVGPDGPGKWPNGHDPASESKCEPSRTQLGPVHHRLAGLGDRTRNSRADSTLECSCRRPRRSHLDP